MIHINHILCTDAEILEFNKNYNVDLISFAKNNPILDFGITVKRSSIRHNPNNTPVFDENKFDLMQECACLPLCPLVIIEKRGLWYFIQTEYCSGWTLCKNVGVLSKKMFEDFIHEKNFYIVTDPYIKIGDVEYFMSSKLPANGTNKIKIPCLNNGLVEWETLNIPSEGVHKNYLPYKRCNLISQAIKLLGIPYDWGEKNSGIDCSALTKYVYSCCGINLPRNSSMQHLVGHPVHIYEEISGALPGDIIYSPGHVMIYLGDNFVVHASYSNKRVVISKL